MRKPPLHSESGEVSSWLMVAAALAAAAVLAGSAMGSTISQLVERVGSAAGISVSAGGPTSTATTGSAGSGSGSGAAGSGSGSEPAGSGSGSTDSGSSTDSDSGTDAASDSSNTAADPAATGTASTVELTDAEIAAANALIELAPDGDPRSDAAQRLHDLISNSIDDPELAAEVYRLALSGVPIDWALAEATGDYSNIDGPIELEDYTDDDRLVILRSLGFDEPESLVGGSDDLFEALPPWLLQNLLNDGRSYEVALSLGQVGTPGTLFLPVGGSAGIEATASVSLSNPQIGVGFGQTQELEISARVVAQIEGSAGKSKLAKVYKRLRQLGAVPPGLQDLVSRNPLLRGALKGLPFSVAYNQFYGTELAYEATLTTAQADAMQAGNLGALPDVFDPSSFEAGNSVLIRGGTIEGSNFMLRYKALEFNEGRTEFNGVGFGVTALDDGRVAIYSGSIEAVERQSGIGIPFVSIGASHTNTDYDLQYAEIDLSTPEGQAIYADFITGGGVPRSDGAGVVTATSEVHTYDYNLGVQVDLGPLVISESLNSEGFTTETVRYSNGYQETSYEAGYGESAVQVVAPHGSNGEPDFEQATLTVVLGNLGPGEADAVNVGYNGTSAIDRVNLQGNYNAQVTFTASDLIELRDTARVAVRNVSANDEHYNDRLDRPYRFHENLAAANTVQEIAEVLISEPQWNPGDLAVGLQQVSTFAVDFDDPTAIGVALPGELVLQPIP